MKSIAFLLFAGILVCINSLSAQQLRFGLQTGPAISQISTPNKPDVDPRTYHPKLGFQAGVFISYETAEKWGLSLEPGVILKGSDQRIDNASHLDIRLAYLQVPVLASYQIAPNIRVLAGPEFSCLLDATFEDEVMTYDMNAIYDRDVELAVLIGLQYRLAEKVELGLRMSHALTYATNLTWTGDNGEPAGKTNEYNQYLQLLLRWNI